MHLMQLVYRHGRTVGTYQASNTAVVFEPILQPMQWLLMHRTALHVCANQWTTREFVMSLVAKKTHALRSTPLSSGAGWSHSTM